MAKKDSDDVEKLIAQLGGTDWYETDPARLGETLLELSDASRRNPPDREAREKLASFSKALRGSAPRHRPARDPAHEVRERADKFEAECVAEAYVKACRESKANGETTTEVLTRLLRREFLYREGSLKPYRDALRVETNIRKALHGRTPTLRHVRHAVGLSRRGQRARTNRSTNSRS